MGLLVYGLTSVERDDGGYDCKERGMKKGRKEKEKERTATFDLARF